jgi:ribosome-associated protein
MVYIIPKNELEIKYIRSSGPGGQNINKVSTKVRLKWNVDKSLSFTDREKEIIKGKLKNYLDKKNNILITSEETRFQKRNEDLAIDHLNFLVSEALIPEKERIPTKPTKASKINKLKEKKEISFKKQLRKKVPGNYEE